MTCRNYDIICCRSYSNHPSCSSRPLPLAALIVAAFAAVEQKTNPNRNNKLLLVVESDFTIINGNKE
jgi:hypothetical protein